VIVEYRENKRTLRGTGDKTNNNPNNLFVCESKTIHQDIHTQLEDLSMILVKSGVI
jgi:hypothetical protein